MSVVSDKTDRRGRMVLSVLQRLRVLLGIALHKQQIKINVDYSLPIEELIDKCQFDWHMFVPEAKLSYPVNYWCGSWVPTGTLMCFGKEMERWEAYQAISDRGFRPGSLQELLALAAENPSLEHNRIVALEPIIIVPGKSKKDDSAHVPMVTYQGGHTLSLFPVDVAFPGYTYFLAFPDGA